MRQFDRMLLGMEKAICHKIPIEWLTVPDKICCQEYYGWQVHNLENGVSMGEIICIAIIKSEQDGVGRQIPFSLQPLRQMCARDRVEMVLEEIQLAMKSFCCGSDIGGEGVKSWQCGIIHPVII